MRYTILIIASILVIATIGTTAVFMFGFPYNPISPPRANDKGSTEQGITQVANSNNEFAIKMYNQLKNKDGNIFFSPYSIYSAIAMVYEGAGGNTEKQLETQMPFPNYSILEPNFAAIYNKINLPNKNYILRTGNAIWINKDFKIRNDYKGRVKEYYGAMASILDFKNQPEKSRETINDFISKQTNGKIPEIIPPGGVNPSTIVVITNAIYFKGTWVYEFDKKDTYEQNFYTPNGTVSVQMMHMHKKPFKYANVGFAQILELPYKGNLSMVIILPNKNSSINDLEEKLNYENLTIWLSKMEKTKINEIAIPKFEFRTKIYDLKDYFMNMGMTDIFGPTCNLSKMGGGSVSDIFHRGYIRVDEKGTEAAAATAVNIVTAAPSPNQINFIADHPFIFLIKDDRTGVILFMGRIVNPE